MPITVNHQGQFPVLLCCVQSSRAGLAGRCRGGGKQGKDGSRVASQYSGGQFQGTAEAFQPLAGKPVPVPVLAAVCQSISCLAFLYESLHPPDHDSFHAAFRGDGSFAGLYRLR